MLLGATCNVHRRTFASRHPRLTGIFQMASLSSARSRISCRRSLGFFPSELGRSMRCYFLVRVMEIFLETSVLANRRPGYPAI